MEGQATSIAGNLLTAGTIIKIWLIEFAVCELFIAFFIALKFSFPKNFSMSLDGQIVAAAGGRMSDFIVMTLFAFFVTAVVSLFLWAGQGLLSYIYPLTFRLR